MTPFHRRLHLALLLLVAVLGVLIVPADQTAHAQVSPTAVPQSLISAIRLYIEEEGWTFLGNCQTITSLNGYCYRVDTFTDERALVGFGPAGTGGGPRVVFAQVGGGWGSVAACAGPLPWEDTGECPLQPYQRAPAPWVSTDKPSYREGDPIRICFGLRDPGSIRLSATLHGQDSQVLAAWEDDGTGDCIVTTIVPPTGRECLRLEYWGPVFTGSLKTCYQSFP
jgi:hypothetical protein